MIGVTKQSKPNEPTGSQLSDSDVDDMEFFFDNMI